MERPQKPYFDLFDEKGISYCQKDGVLTVQGRLTPGVYRLPGNVSSQFVTGLLYALPLLDGDSKIVLTSELESRSYADMTLQALDAFHVQAGWTDAYTLSVPGGQAYRPAEVWIETDWSQAAFWFAAVCLGNNVEVAGLCHTSLQGDRAVAGYAESLRQPGDVEINVSDCPDLAPPLAVMAALRRGTTCLSNAARLRIKESDRLASITAALNTLGAAVEEHADSLTIHGQAYLQGDCAVDCCNDHRIAMMCAVAATRCRKPVALLGAECVAKSYPNFWDDYRMLGGCIHEYVGK